MRIYLDNCCYNRPFDNQSYDRIHDESEAVLSIIKRSLTVKNIILGSTVLNMEIDNIKNSYRKEQVKFLYSCVSEYIIYCDDIKDRAIAIMQQSNIKKMDSLHIASAEYGNADILLTTDDKLIKASKNIYDLKLRILNPVTYLAEVIEND